MITDSPPSEAVRAPQTDERPAVAVLVDGSPHAVLPLLEVVARPVVFRSHVDLVAAARTTDITRIIAPASLCTTKILAAIGSVCGAGTLAFWYGPGSEAGLVEAAAKNHAFTVLPAPDETGFVEAVELWLWPRASTRIAMAEAGCTMTLDDGSQIAGDLRDISSFGMLAHVPCGTPVDALVPGVRVHAVAIHVDGARVLDDAAGVIRHLSVSRTARDASIDGYRLGIELESVARWAGKRQPRVERVVRDRVQVLGYLQSAVGHAEVTVRAANEPELSASCSATAVNAERRTVQLTGELPACLEATDSLELSFDLWGRNYRCATTLLQAHDRDVATVRVPRVLVERAGRRMGRFRPPAGVRISATLQSALPGMRPVRVEVIDVTTTGCAFVVDSDSVAFPAGKLVDRVVLHFATHSLEVGAARVRSVERHGGKRIKCGLEFLPLSAPQRTRVYEAVMQCDESGVRPANGYSFDELWTFLREAGFLYPAKLERIDAAAVRETFEVLLDPETHVSRTLVFERDGETYGHVSAVRAYSRTCLAQHLAARRELRGVPLGRLLTKAMVRFQEFQPDVEWMKLYFRPSNPWPRLVFGSFAAQAADAVTVDYRVHDYLILPVIGSVEAPPPGVHRASAEEEPLVEAYFVERGRTAQLRAEDFAAGRLGLQAVDREYRAVGLARRRECLIYAEHGRMRGFAALEFSSAGLNLSELTNSFQIFLVDDDPTVCRALAMAAVQRYADLGYRRCIALADGATSEQLQQIGFSKEKEYASLIWHRSTYGHYAEHVQRVTGSDYA